MDETLDPPISDRELQLKAVYLTAMWLEVSDGLTSNPSVAERARQSFMVISVPHMDDIVRLIQSRHLLLYLHGRHFRSHPATCSRKFFVKGLPCRQHVDVYSHLDSQR